MNTKSIIFLFAGLLVFVTLVYSNHFNNSFHFDDSHTILNNLYIQDVKNIPLFFKDATTFSSLPQNQSYRPVVSASLAIDYWLGHGYNPYYFHLSSFILFLLLGLLLLYFITRIYELSWKRPGSIFIAFIPVAWFMVHPCNSETINYIIARSDLQSTFFVVLAFVLYQYVPFCRKTLLYLVPVCIGALAKPPAIMFAPLFFLYVAFFEFDLSIPRLFHKKYKYQVKAVLLRVLPAFIFCIFLYAFIADKTPATWVGSNASLWDYLVTQPFVMVNYFCKFFLPTGLSADTDWQLQPNILTTGFFIGVIFILVMLLLAILTSKDIRTRPISFGIWWFFIALVPSSTIFPLSEVLNYHRVFFPYIGLAIAVCWSLFLLFEKYKAGLFDRLSYNRWLPIVIAGILAAYGIGTYRQNRIWKTEESLWYDVTIKSPGNGRGLMNYGLTKMTVGDYSAADHYFMQALKIWPLYPTLHINLGVLKEATGDTAEAVKYFTNALSYGSGYPEPWFFYARYLVHRQRYLQAAPLLVQCLRLAPAHIEARRLLMLVYNETANWPALETLTQNTLQIIPDDKETLTFLRASKQKKSRFQVITDEIEKQPTAEKYLDLSLLYYNVRKYRESIDAASAALQLKPGYIQAYNNIGSALVAEKQYDSAIIIFQNILSVDPGYQLAKNNLADALNKKNLSR